MKGSNGEGTEIGASVRRKKNVNRPKVSEGRNFRREPCQLLGTNVEPVNKARETSLVVVWCGEFFNAGKRTGACRSFERVLAGW
jgi:hypothetical protein